MSIHTIHSARSRGMSRSACMSSMRQVGCTALCAGICYNPASWRHRPCFLLLANLMAGIALVSKCMKPTQVCSMLRNACRRIPGQPWTLCQTIHASAGSDACGLPDHGIAQLLALASLRDTQRARLKCGRRDNMSVTYVLPCAPSLLPRLLLRPESKGRKRAGSKITCSRDAGYPYGQCDAAEAGAGLLRHSRAPQLARACHSINRPCTRRWWGRADLAQQGDLLPGPRPNAYIGGGGHEVQLVAVQARPVLLVLHGQGDEVVPPGRVAGRRGDARQRHHLHSPALGACTRTWSAWRVHSRARHSLLGTAA